VTPAWIGEDDVAPGAKPGQPTSSSHWYQRKQSDYPWEQDGLDFIKKLMPNAEPYRAWATFSFTAASGRINECDLLIAVPSGLHLLELKAHPGRVANHSSTWRVTDPNSGKIRTFENPLELTDLKAKELKGQLQRAAQKLGINRKIPWIEPIVFLTASGLKSELDEFQRPKVFARHAKSGLPAIWDDLLALPPNREAHRITPEFSARILPKLMEAIGIRPASADLRYGDDWKLEPRPLDAGSFWEDRLAKRDDGYFKEEGRVRIYLVRDKASESDTEKANRAALREYQVLQGINHRGIVQAVQFREHRGRPAILFRHAESDLRLDAYLATFGASLGQETRLDMVRQLGEALHYAHDRSLYHRALSPRSVYVSCKEDGSKPILRLTDWQTAARDFETTSLRSIGDSSLDGAFIEDTAQRYLAPETEQPYPDPVDLDVFGLGSVSYLILTGKPPASTRAELLDRLRRENGLRMSAIDDTVLYELEDLVYDATRADITLRLDSAATFLQRLSDAQQETQPPQPTSTSYVDPLEAVAGQEVDEGWEVRKILGTGATARALLVERARELDTGDVVIDERVFKVALDEEKASRLHEEAEALRTVRGGVIVQLLDGPRQLSDHTMLELELAGEESLAKRLRERGRLTYHELERFGGDLFTALDQLAAAGVRHRDIKPENFGIYRRADRVNQLKLFDFSLTKASDRDITAGTRGYLDPFLGASPRRQVFDDHAERYAAAVTLYEMATGERPRWGDGVTAPAMTQDETPRIEADLFEPGLREGLTEFFQHALNRDTEQRYVTSRQMEDAWRAVFLVADNARPATTQSTQQDNEALPTDVDHVRNLAAEAATLDTPLDAAGLSPRAVSVANGYGATVVRQLLDVAPYLLSRARGAGALTRRELTRRHRQWTTKLLSEAEANAATPSPDVAVPVDAGRQSVDILAERLTPPETGKKGKAPTVVRLALGLPSPDGAPSALGAWPTQQRIAAQVDLRQPTVSKYFVDAVKSWQDLDWLAEIRREVVGIVEDLGRVASAQEVAAEFRARHGAVPAPDELTLAKSLAVVRAAVETELATANKGTDDSAEPELAVLRRNEIVLIACESLDGSDEPNPNELADYAIVLGNAADVLSGRDPLPGSATVLRDLKVVTAPEGMRPLADTRLVALAATMSHRSAASRRLELYPRDLGLVRALRISQAAAGTLDEGIALEALLAKVRARFPEIVLDNLTYVEVGEALAESGSQLSYDTDRGTFRPPQSTGGRSQRTSSSTMTSIDTVALSTGRTSVELLSSRLAEAARLGGFLAITLKAKYLPGVADALIREHRLVGEDLGRLFLAEFRTVASERNQAWDRVLTADTRVTRGVVPPGLGTYVTETWRRVQTRLIERMSQKPANAVLFLHDAGLLGRYWEAGGRRFLTDLQHEARLSDGVPHGLWVLCPGEAPSESPRLGGELVEVMGDHERATMRSEYLELLRRGVA